MTFKCMIIDDEPLAHTVLEEYIKKINTLEIATHCSNAYDAIAYLQQNKIDIIFLDINMPDFTGMDFLESIENRPKIIITSAYSEYALKSYEYSVTDYLLKPFPFERFVKAINKAIILNTEPKDTEKTNILNEGFTFFKSDKVNHKVFYRDINYIEAYGNFIKIHKIDETILVNDTMNNLEKSLPQELFLRFHRSYIASIEKIKLIKRNTIRIAEKELPIGSIYKERVKNIAAT